MRIAGDGRRVLVTRPQPAAARTAEKLAEAGFAPALLPLSRTVALPFSLDDDGFDALAVTSANAFRHLPADILERLRPWPLFAVGAGTAKAARAAGFAAVSEGGGDALRLAETLARALPARARVLYLAGRERQPVFEQAVAAAGLRMEAREVYDAEPVAYSAAALDTALHGAPFAAALLYSGLAARRLGEILNADMPAFDRKTRFLCISARVAEALPAAWRGRALSAARPDETGLFDLFAKL